MKRKREIIFLIVIATVLVINKNANADFTFGIPIPVPNVNSEYVDGGPRISSDDLMLFFVSSKPGWGDDDWDIWMSKRANKTDPWGEPQNLGPNVNSSFEDAGQSISTDGLSLYFYSLRSGGYGSADIWVTTRATLEDEWGEPKNLGPNVNSPQDDAAPTISADGLTLYFVSRRPGSPGDDFWVARRPTVDDDWGPAENMGPPICSLYGEWTSEITSDDLIFFFSDNYARPRPDGLGLGDIYMSRRSGINDSWSEPVNLGIPINSPFDDGGVSISADGSTIYFHSNRPDGPGSYDIWQAPIEPVVDLNGDGIVDADDMCIIVDNWGTDNSLCDIGPMPWGDGVVDVQDLIVLAEHLFEEIPPVEPVE